LIGDFLTQTLSWRWFFFVNIPVAVLAIILTLVAVRKSRDESASPYVDFTGLRTITAGLAALVLAIQQGGTLGWDSLLVIGALIAAMVLLGLFFLVEPRLRQPLIDLGLFANCGYVGANGVPSRRPLGSPRCCSFSPSTCKTSSATRLCRPDSCFWRSRRSSR
jgi:MFS family permease